MEGSVIQLIQSSATDQKMARQSRFVLCGRLQSAPPAIQKLV
jgi:hypothetical protein